MQFKTLMSFESGSLGKTHKFNDGIQLFNFFAAFLLYLTSEVSRTDENGKVLSFYELRAKALPSWNHISKSARDGFKTRANQVKFLGFQKKIFLRDLKL